MPEATDGIPAGNADRPVKIFDMREEKDGSWTIYVLSTGLPASFGGELQAGKSWLEALFIVALMNRRALRNHVGEGGN